ncbi:MAG TPA: hypothetical protein DD733_12775 [Clostridiales bacterium]|nr:hypothetical protein [Clostridiales bacterium]
MIEKIEEDSRAACNEVMEKAQAEALAIIKKAQDDSLKALTEAVKKAEAEAVLNIELVTSKAEHERKKAVLTAKNGIIDEIVKEALQRLKAMNTEDYFKVIMELVVRYAQNGNGLLRFSKEDLDRIPTDFEAETNKMLAGSNKTISVSRQPVSVDGGFVIVYDDIEQNCSFDSLLNASYDEIRDEVYKEIFMRDGI